MVLYTNMFLIFLTLSSYMYVFRRKKKNRLVVKELVYASSTAFFNQLG